mgnify:CR=1 FL=1
MGRLILITNDDGIDAGGIRQLAETAKAFGEVWVVAPESQRSGKSHSVTYLEPLYVRERPGYMDGVKAYECSGVPVDCVRVGIHLLGRKPDVVLSGINSGYKRQAPRWRLLSGGSTPSRFPRPTSIIIP